MEAYGHIALSDDSMLNRNGCKPFGKREQVVAAYALKRHEVTNELLTA